MENSGFEGEQQVFFELRKGSGNGFSDVAGMEELKQMIAKKVLFVLKERDKAIEYKLTIPNGMLLYGPPGCGKTYFAEKLAEEIGYNYVICKGSDLGSTFVHGTQGKIAQLFKIARENAPTVIILDEFDALVPSRDQLTSAHLSSEVNEFLSQLNNSAKNNVFVVATTNRPDKIDSAVLRTGRMDLQVYIPMPDQKCREAMFAHHLKGRPYSDIILEVLASASNGLTASDIAYIVNDVALAAAFENKQITQQMLLKSIGSFTPSVTPAQLAKYERIYRTLSSKGMNTEQMQKIIDRFFTKA
ncbi:MAG: ATP-binding protein [Bacteroidales bacterium]|nr:ATP-binding protein [Bacteroidales bacterium]